MHGADLSCAPLCRSSVFSVLSHPSPSDRPPPYPSVSPFFYPQFSHTGSLFSDLFSFSASLSTIGAISHTTHVPANTSFLSLVAVSLQFSLISSSFIPLFLASPGTVFFQPTLFHSPPPQLPTFPPNLALTSICLLISKCSPLPSVLSWCC